MVLGFLTRDFKISGKKFLAVLLLFFPSFAWFYLFENYLRLFITSFSADPIWENLGLLLYYASIVSSAIIGSIISGKWNRKRFLSFWIFFGIITTISVALFQGLMFSLFSGIFVGASFGLGFPAILACFAEFTTVEERGRVSGALILITFVTLISIIGLMSNLQLFGTIESLFIIIILRATSFSALLLDPCEKVACKKSRWMTALTTHGFWLYFISWLMFSVAAGTFGFIGLPKSLEQVRASGLGTMLLFAGTVISALIAGFAADKYGRKNIILFGLISLGISYIFFGIASTEISYLLTRIIYGAAWGIFFVVYGFTVIGDLAYTCSKEKLMTIGVIPPFIVLGIFQTLSGTFSFSIEPGIISAILGVISLVSLIPLIYAPETLPREKIIRKQLEEHLARAKELQEKLKEKKNQQ